MGLRRGDGFLMMCIYCDGRRDDRQTSLEHIWPQSLGGACSPELFQSQNVCQTCNNLAGLWVDGAFLKSWFISHEAGGAARQYLDPAKPGVVPLVYMGEDQDFPNQSEEICERWIGPAGEHVYHVHLRDDDRWYGYAGGDVIRRRRRDPGRAYLILTSQNPYWVLTGLKSFIAHFSKGTRLFCLTKIVGLPPEFTSGFIAEESATSIEATEMEWIFARPDEKQHLMRLSLRLDFSDRFLAKLSLGLGANLFGAAYCMSSYADELRKLLWSRLPSTDERPKVRGTNFWQEADLSQISKLTSLPGAWTILLQAAREGFALYLCTPGGRGMTMALSDDCSFWAAPEFQPYREGILYFAIPARQTFVGPIALPRYLAHKLGNFVEPTLAKLEAMKSDPALLPKMR